MKNNITYRLDFPKITLYIFLGAFITKITYTASELNQILSFCEFSVLSRVIFFTDGEMSHFIQPQMVQNTWS